MTDFFFNLINLNLKKTIDQVLKADKVSVFLTIVLSSMSVSLNHLVPIPIVPISSIPHLPPFHKIEGSFCARIQRKNKI
jgi:hypothetical protein